MKHRSKTRHLLAVVIVAALIAEATVGFVTPPAIDAPEEGAATTDAVERTWEGGGSRLMFVDDMRAQTRDHHESSGAGVTQDYYGGALPEARDGPERWAQEMYRWGTHALEGPPGGWGIGQNEWRFGDDVDGEPGYLGGAHAELVTPVIDLRSVPSPPGLQAHASGPDEVSCSDRFDVDAVCPDAVQSAQQILGPQYQSVLPGGEREVEDPVWPATAALRIRHEYDFQVAAGGEARDGGRVEVSRLDAGTGTWTPWEGIEPTDRSMEIGEDRLRGRTVVAGILVDASVGADPGAGDPSADADVHAADLVSVGADQDGTVSPEFGDRPKPHMYQAPITSSTHRGGPWSGFGTDSGGMVESVFDLSSYAGDRVRLRFIVSTAESLDPPRTPGERGWILDHVEVHAARADPVDVVGLSVPGQGAVLAPGVDVEPSVVLHNTGRQEVEAVVSTTIGGVHQSQKVRLGVGPSARAVVPTGHAMTDLDAGLYLVDVDVSVEQDASSDASQGSAAAQTTHASFHFAASNGGDWAPRQLTFLPLVEDGEGGLVEDPSGSRAIARDQRARIHVLLDSLGPSEETVRLGSSSSTEWDLRPALVDELGNEFGNITVVSPEQVSVPPSRELSGTFGTPGSTRVTWEWSGTDNARALHLVMKRDSENPQDVLDGGVVVVQSTLPPALSADFRNPWVLDPDGFAACARTEERLGAHGVAHCPQAPARIVSPATRVQEIDLLRGNETSVQASYLGGPLSITLQAMPVPVPGDLPPASEQWSDVTTVSLPQSGSWTRTDRALAPVADGFSGFVRIVLDAEEPVDLDLVRLAMRVGGGEESLLVPLVSQTWDVTFGAGRPTVEASSDSGLVHLHGHDGVSSSLTADQEITGVGDLEADRGDVSLAEDFVFGGVNEETHHVAAGRSSEDAFLVLPGPLDLSDVARPELSFRHWYQLGPHGKAFVEVATAPSPVPADAPGSAAGHAVPEEADGWRILAEYRYDRPDLVTREARVTLSDFVGQSVHVRFRYQVDPTVLSRTDSPMELGWAIEDVEVSGWNTTGPVHLHGASPGFPGYALAGGEWLGPTLEVPSRSNCWERQEQTWAIAQETGCNTPRGVSTLVTNAIHIGAMQTPAITLRTSGDLSGEVCRGGNLWFPAVDVEYQVRRRDGTWPVEWIRADPVRLVQGGSPGAQTAFWYYEPVGVDDDEPVTPLVDPRTGLPSDKPFSLVEGARQECRATAEWWRTGDGFSYEDGTHRFSLAPLHRLGAQSEPIRLRLDAWVESYLEFGPYPSLGSLEVHAVEVAEFRHAVDASVDSIRLLADDTPHLEAQAAAVLQEHAPQGEAVVGTDLVPLAVNVTNEGFVPLDVSVSLQGSSVDGTPLDVTWIQQRDGAQVPTGLRTGTLSDLAPGATGQLLFRTNMLDVPPGEYAFTARVDVLNGVDTNPGNDRVDRQVRLLPFRDLAVDVASSGVQPFATGAEQPRTLRVTVVNDGNVDESSVRVDAEIVRMTGLTRFEPLDPPLPVDVLEAWQGSLARRGDGRQTVQWDLDPGDLPQGFDIRQVFRPGQKYAVKVTVEAGPDSVLTWWPPKGNPLAETQDGTGLLNITRMPVEDCQCALIPFIVERELYATDLTPANSTTVLGDAWPVETLEDILEGWSSQTHIGEEPVQGEERPDLPGWSLVPASAVGDDFEGRATGQVWHLPAYEGLEVVEHELVSAPMPAHIVRDDSRAILSLRYAMDGLADGQVKIETRQEVGGTWSPWEPVDALRAGRVAVVVPPDFPRTIAGGLSAPEDAYDVNSLRPGHPTPPFYDNALNLDHIQVNGYYGPDDQAPACGDGRPICDWSPPPDFDAPDNAQWLEALNETLRLLSARLGPANVGLFTTPSDDLGIGIEEQGTLFHEVQDGPLTYRFPIEEMDALGLRLDTYGAILLVGDNATSTFADRSQALLRVSHGPGEWAYQTPTQTALQHHEDLFAILRAAPDAGVRVLGAIGPAAATLSLSEAVGEAGSVPMAVWQTSPHMPRDMRLDSLNIHCTGEKPDIGEPRYNVPPDHAAQQPLPACRRPGQTEAGVVDASDPHNYYRIAPRDAQSMALQDFVRTIATDDFRRTVGTNTIGNCQPDLHPLIVQPGQGAGYLCRIFAEHHNVQVGDVAVVTAGWPDGVGTWSESVVDILESADGALPPGDGSWSDLPPRLAFPVGGEFWRDGEGRERFDGAPTQIRITVRSDPDLGGHGSVAIDRIGLLGTNRTQGIGVEFVTPQPGSSHAPGRSFVPVLQVTNRGVVSTNATSGTVSAQQWVKDGTECLAADVADVQFAVDDLHAGQRARIPIEPPSSGHFSGGVFPHDPDCPLPDTQQEYVFNFTAALDHAGLPPQERPFDDDPRDDVDRIVAVGRELVQIDVPDVRIRPAQAVAAEAGTVTVEATVTSSSTQPQPVTMDVTLYHARPLTCDRGTGGDSELYGCGPDDQPAHPIALPAQGITRVLQRGETSVLSLPIESQAAGVYRARVEVFTLDADQQIRDRSVRDLWLHLGADGDVDAAREILPPDGGFAVEATTLEDEASGTLPTTPQAGGWNPFGFFLQGDGNHNGAFGPDSDTRDSVTDEDLSHGWRTLTGEDACQDCADARTSIIEWRRDGTPSYREGVDPASWSNEENPLSNPDSAEGKGFGDFGPDRLVWIPHDPRDQRQNPERTPYMGLASLEDPALTFLTNFKGTGNTTFVVEMQVPQRVSCQNVGSPPRVQCPEDWSWSTPWLQLAADDAETQARSMSATTFHTFSGQGQVVFAQRHEPSNPLAGQTGLWGQQSGGVHVEDGGWMRLHYPIDIDDPAVRAYCQQVAGFGSGGEASHEDFHPCLYAHASGSGETGPAPAPETFVARPVRFRLSAASYGGDVGPSFWQVADMALTSHRIEVAGPQTIQFTMDDADERRVPVRLHNAGRVEDTVRVTVDDPPGRGRQIGNGGAIEMSRAIGFEDPAGPAEGLLVSLEPGETETVWVRVRTGIVAGAHPGTVYEVPLIVTARSTIDPTATTEVLLDGSFRARAWPDLEVVGLALGEDASDDPFRVSKGSPVQVTARILNRGLVAIGGPETPLRVDLVERQIDPQNGTVINGTARVVQSVQLDQPVRPLREDPSDTLVRFGEWTPPRVGLFRVEAVANPGGALALPEQDFGNNGWQRDVIVGPVSFADLHVTDVWLVEFRDGCGNQTVDHVVAGHAYCVAAHVENRGRLAALEPRASFGIGSGLPFSSGAPSLEEMFEDGLFPGADEEPVGIVVMSSPRVLGDRASGTWSFYVEASSRSIFPNFENKTRELELPVFRFGLEATDAPPNATLSPGAQTVIHFNVTNTGHAPATPRLGLEGAKAYRLVAPDPPRIHPGDTARVTARIAVSPTALEGDETPRLVLSTLEDDLIRLPVPTQFSLEPESAPRAVALSAQVTPGPAEASVLLDNARGPGPVAWSLLDVTGPARAVSWESSTDAFDRRVEAIPLTVPRHTPPGDHTVALRLLASAGAVEHVLDAAWRVRVEPDARLNATGPDDAVVSVAGTPATVPVRVGNGGNVPLRVRMVHDVDEGTLASDVEEFLLRPGDHADVPATVTGTLGRVLGSTAVTWEAPDGTRGTTNLTWELRTVEARVVLISTDLPDLRPRAGVVNTVSARLDNPGNEPVEAEVVVAVDGEVHGRVVLQLEPGLPQDVQVPFRMGPAGEAQQVVLLVRPAGSPLGPGDAGLYDVGDAQGSSLVARGEGRLEVPGPGPLLLVGLLAAMLARRRTS